MAEDAAGDPAALLVWCVAGFHTALLVTVLVLGLVLTGTAGAVLASLETWIGIVVYLYVWGVTWFTADRWIESGGLRVRQDRPRRDLVAAGTIQWGGVTGVLVFAGLAIPGLFAVAASGGVESIPFLVLFVLVGTAVAFLLGGLVGVAFGGLDRLLLRGAASLDPDPSRTRAGGEESTDTP